MIGRTIKKSMGVIMLLVTLFGAGVITTKAEADFSDYYFDFDGAGGDIYSYTRPRRKDDYSSAYVCYTTGNVPIVMTVVAYDVCGVDEDIRKQEIMFYPGMNSYILNWVRENGYNRAVLRGEATTDSMYSGHGIWMPDSDQY
jgi:hypothetical protein